jgi:hypothetical protein
MFSLNNNSNNNNNYNNNKSTNTLHNVQASWAERIRNESIKAANKSFIIMKNIKITYTCTLLVGTQTEK